MKNPISKILFLPTIYMNLVLLNLGAPLILATAGSSHAAETAEETESESVHKFLGDKGLNLPSSVKGVVIKVTGAQDLVESPILLFNKTTQGSRKLVVLVHGWGGDLVNTWKNFPGLFLDSSQFYGIRREV